MIIKADVAIATNVLGSHTHLSSFVRSALDCNSHLPEWSVQAGHTDHVGR